MSLMRRLAILPIVVALLSADVAGAAGPLWVNLDTGVPLVWGSPVVFNPDRGPLGTLGNDAAIDAVVVDFAVWQAVPTASISFAKGSQLPVDVTTANVFDYLDICDGTSPIVFDDDGSITDLLLGDGASSFVLGFAGPSCGILAEHRIVEGDAVLNGKFIDGISNEENPEISLVEFNAVFIHEFGHFINLDHTQVGLEEAFDGDTDNDDAVATMFPILVNGIEGTTLNLDDRVSVSSLYPEGSFATNFGAIGGTVYRLGGEAFTGANVIARNTADPRVAVVSMVSGALVFDGTYRLPGLPPGNYTVELEEIFPEFSGGSSVGPVDPPAALRAVPEFWNGANEAHEEPPDDPTDFVTIAVSGGSSTNGVDILLNSFPPPPNDECADAIMIESLPFDDSRDVGGATTDASPIGQTCGWTEGNSSSVWYALVVPESGTLQVQTSGSDYDTVLSVHEGSCESASELVCDDDTTVGTQSAVTLGVSSGQVLLIQVSAFGSSQPGNLELSARMVPPVDACEPVGGNLLVNGDFDTGDFSGWTVADLDPVPFGNFVVTSGPSLPISGLESAGSSCGPFFAVADQTFMSSNALIQEFTVPGPVSSVTVSFDMFVNDWSLQGPVVAPVGLDHNGDPNQHARVDVMAANAGPFDTGEGVLRNLYSGVDTGTLPQAYTHYEFDITDIAGSGGTFGLRFAQSNNLLYLSVGVDDVRVEISSPPTTTTTTTLPPAECTQDGDCADADSCTQDVCRSGACFSALFTGSDLPRCRIDEARGPLCAEGEIPKKFGKVLSKQLSKASASLAKADAATKEKKRLRHLKRIEVALRKIESKLKKASAKMPVDCAQAIANAVASVRSAMTTL